MRKYTAGRQTARNAFDLNIHKEDIYRFILVISLARNTN